MTAIETIRAMLDERGVEWWDMKTRGVWFGISGREHRFEAYEQTDGLIALNIYDLTPEQAIEATLGRGEVERLQDENGRLRSCLSDSAENAKQIMHEAHVQEAENAKLREQMERLVTLLRVDCDIDASWDGLRRFWSIGLTEDGCLMRDRACKAEAENAKLRELVQRLYGSYYIEYPDAAEREFAGELRELGVEV